MTGGIFFFELVYRGRRRASYIFFVIIFLTSFFIAVSPNPLPAGIVSPNAPAVIALYCALLSFFFTLVSAAVMGAAVIRDHDHNFESILYTSAVTKRSYLAGRFLGSFVVLVLINTALPLGLICGYQSAEFVPWNTGWRGHELLPFNAWSFLQPFLCLTVPDLFITGAFYFTGAALTRKSLVIYTQGVILLIVYQIGYMFANQEWSPYLTAVLDPLGIQVVQQTLRYWSEGDINQMLIPFSGAVLINRIIWTALAWLTLITGYFLFPMSPATGTSGARNGSATPHIDTATTLDGNAFIDHRASPFQKIYSSAIFYARIISREIPFIAFIGAAFLILLVNVLKAHYQPGSDTAMTSGSAALLLNSFNTVISMMVIFYSGELLWTEKNSGIDAFSHAFPVNDFFGLISKLAALTLILLVVLIGSVFCGVLIQFTSGQYVIDFSAFLVPVFLGALPDLLLIMILSVFVQTLANNKFIGFTLCIVLVLLVNNLNTTVMENELLHFGSGHLVMYSAMNGYSGFIFPYLLLKIYWLSFGMVLVLIASLLVPRGSDTTIRNRIREACRRVNRRWTYGLFAALALAITLGSLIYYQTHVSEKFESASDKVFRLREYDTRFGRFRNLAQPVLIREEIALTLWPRAASFSCAGTYTLRNTTSTSIGEILVCEPFDPHIQYLPLVVDRALLQTTSDNSGKIHALRLAQPLEPGTELKLKFQANYSNSGFVSKSPPVVVVKNGTFITNSLVPKIGFDAGLNADENDRSLQENGRAPDGYFSNSDTLTVSVVTDDDQYVVGPGKTFSKKLADQRVEFSFLANIAPGNRFAIVSGNFLVAEARWKYGNIFIRHSGAQKEVTDEFIKVTAGAMEQCSRIFSDASAQDVNVVEVPAFNQTTEGYAGMIPFSENSEFISRIRHDSAVHWLGYNTAYWTVKQYMERSFSCSSKIFTTAFPHLYALRILKGSVNHKGVMDHNRDLLKKYLAGRQALVRPETPLSSESGARFLYETKGPLVFSRLESFMGVAGFDSAMSDFRNRAASDQTIGNFVSNFESRVPDSLRYMVHELFRKVIAYDNSVGDASYTVGENGKYELLVNYEGRKSILNDRIQEQGVVFNEWIDVGIFSADARGVMIPTTIKRVRIHAGKNTLRVLVTRQPDFVTLDPYSFFIDTQPDNNALQTRQTVDLTGVEVP